MNTAAIFDAMSKYANMETMPTTIPRVIASRVMTAWRFWNSVTTALFMPFSYRCVIVRFFCATRLTLRFSGGAQHRPLQPVDTHSLRTPPQHTNRYAGLTSVMANNPRGGDRCNSTTKNTGITAESICTPVRCTSASCDRMERPCSTGTCPQPLNRFSR